MTQPVAFLSQPCVWVHKDVDWKGRTLCRQHGELTNTDHGFFVMSGFTTFIVAIQLISFILWSHTVRHSGRFRIISFIAADGGGLYQVEDGGTKSGLWVYSEWVVRMWISFIQQTNKSFLNFQHRCFYFEVQCPAAEKKKLTHPSVKFWFFYHLHHML